MAFSDRRPAVGIQADALGVRLCLAASAVVSVLMLAWILWYCRYGIDFADEGFYLAWIADPFRYGISTTQFGFVYHPLYVLLGRSVVALRLANVLLTFMLAWALSYLCLSEVFARGAMGRLVRLVLSAALATATFVFLRLWLPTPSYNWLTFQALIVAAIGLLLVRTEAGGRGVAGWLLLAVGGWLAFLAKPPAAVALAVCASVYLMGARKWSTPWVAASAAMALLLLLLSAFAIDGSLAVFVQRLQTGTELAKVLGAGHVSHLFRLDNFHMDESAKMILLASTASIFCAGRLMSSRARVSAYAGYLVAIVFVAATLSILLGRPAKPLEAGEFEHLVLWSAPLAAFLLGVVLLPGNVLHAIPRAHWALGGLFWVLPFCFAFGTSNNYWWFAGLLCLFWILAGLIFLAPLVSSRKITLLLLPLGLGVQLMTATQAFSGMEGPYYQPQPLRMDDQRVDFGRQGGRILLPRSYGDYIGRAMTLARQAHFSENSPMIDITGHSPGVLYAIGASNTAAPWLIGNYPGYAGSEKVVIRLLHDVPCEELAAAWLLAEPEGPVKLSPQVLASFGANLSTDYEVVGSFHTVPVVGGFTEPQQQQFLRPVRPLAVAASACEAAKTQKP